MIVPDVFNFELYFNVLHYNYVRILTSKRKNKRLFRTLKKGSINGCIKKYVIKKLKDESDITVNKIENFQFYNLVAKSAVDPAVASILTSTNISKTKVQLHYTTVPVDFIVKEYLAASMRLISKINQQNYGYDVQNTLILFRHQEGFAGNRFCPKDSYLIDLISHLKRKVTDKELFSSDYMSYHNFYTVYSLVMQGYNTAYREVGSPHVTDKDVVKLTTQSNIEILIAAISDKDNSESYKTRAINLNDETHKQRDNLVEQNKLTRNKLHSKNKRLYEATKSLSLFLFVADNNNRMRIQIPRPKDIKFIIKDFFV